MNGFPALDVALGLSFLYFLLSTMATAVTEIILRAFNWRARTLEKWLDKTLATGVDHDRLGRLLRVAAHCPAAQLRR